MKSIFIFGEGWRPLGFLTLLVLAASGTQAGEGGFFTTYTSVVEPGETELMVMNDVTAPSHAHRSDGQRTYASNMFEVEYGASRHLALELMLEGFEEPGRTAEFNGYRLEARYRLFAREVPLNPMLYVEWEDLSADSRFKMEVSGWVDPPYRITEKKGRDRTLESRLVLSQSWRSFTFAVNPIFETSVPDGTTAFGYAVGAMWMPGHAHHHAVGEAGRGCGCEASMPGCGCGHCSRHDGTCTCSTRHSLGLGLELYGGLGDTRAFRLFSSRQEHYLAPTVVWHLTPRVMIHGQLGVGLTRSSDQLLRLSIGYEP